MRFNTIIILMLLSLECTPKVNYNYILCDSVVLSLQNSDKGINICSINETMLIKTFGEPDTIIKYEMPVISKDEYFKRNLFEISEDNMNTAFRLRTNAFKVIIKDTMKLEVGDSIDLLTKRFTISANNQKDESGNTKSIILYLCEQKDLQNIRGCTSRIIITYLASTNKIFMIEKIDID
jgi:hypothetical protein